jgi:hypothetical protein
MKVIEIKWEGPLTAAEVRALNDKQDYGLYQVYGNHRIYGENVLLYLGKANQQTFAKRLPQHDDWFEWADAELKFYVGRFGNSNNVELIDWEEQIDFAEGELIGYCQPAWNSSGLNSRKKLYSFTQAVISNFGIRRMLPQQLNNIKWENCSLNLPNWKVFSSDDCIKSIQ